MSALISNLIALKSATTFHRFGEFPAELQINIWKMAFLDGPCRTHTGILIAKERSLCTALKSRFKFAPEMSCRDQNLGLPIGQPVRYPQGWRYSSLGKGILNTSIYSVAKHVMGPDQEYTKENCYTWMVPNLCMATPCNGWCRIASVGGQGEYAYEETTLLGGVLGPGGQRYRMILKTNTSLVTLLQLNSLARIAVLEEWKNVLQERIKQNEKKRDADRAKKGKNKVVRKTITRNGRVLELVEKMLEECRR